MKLWILIGIIAMLSLTGCVETMTRSEGFVSEPIESLSVNERDCRALCKDQNWYVKGEGYLHSNPVCYCLDSNFTPSGTFTLARG